MLALAGAAAPSFAQQPSTPSTPSSYRQETEEWRVLREKRLKTDDGWLTVAGLFWLKQGSNTLGADASHAVALPPNSAPKDVGVFYLKGTDVSLAWSFTLNEPLLVNGANVASESVTPDTPPLAIQSDEKGKPDEIRINDLTLFVVKRGERYGIRLRDKNSEARKTFAGCKWYPVKEEYRIQAKYVLYDKPKTLLITNIIGDTEPKISTGYAVFTLNGKEYRLEAQSEGNKLFFNFRDGTSDKSTYPAGRFLYADAPADGTVTLDFNKAVNPPCAFTAFATCPLPPRSNWLTFPIEAGELTHHPAELTSAYKR